jgi:hypothetical protein
VSGQKIIDGLREAVDAETHRLCEEVAFWRKNSAATIEMLLASIEASAMRGEIARATDLEVNILRPQVAALTEALAGDFHQRCEACGDPLLNGQPVFSDINGGEFHAACVGEPASNEGFVDEDGEPLAPDAPRPEPRVGSRRSWPRRGHSSSATPPHRRRGNELLRDLPEPRHDRLRLRRRYLHLRELRRDRLPGLRGPQRR